MLISLQRDSSVKEFLQQKFPDSSNNLLSWAIISLVFCLVFSTLISQYIPIIPKKIAEIQIFGYELNKFGFTFITVSGFYLIKNISTYFFFAGTGSIKKWEVFHFTTSKFYFVFSVLLILLCIVHYFYDIDSLLLFNYYYWGLLLAFLFKQIFYITHKNNILPKKWYYKFLYICTLQIAPLLVLWKLFFL